MQQIKAFSLIEVLIVVFLISLLYFNISNYMLPNIQHKKLVLNNDNLCYNLKTIYKNNQKNIKFTIKEIDNKIQYLFQPSIAEDIKLDIEDLDFDNFYTFNAFHSIIQKEFNNNLFEYNIYKGKYCEEYLYMKDEKYFIQLPYKYKTILFEQ